MNKFIEFYARWKKIMDEEFRPYAVDQTVLNAWDRRFAELDKAVQDMLDRETSRNGVHDGEFY